MSKILLEAQHIQKFYGERCLLDIDRLHIYDGERIGLIGENGAGKSTLLSILMGEIVPEVGEIRRYCPMAMIHQSGESRVEIKAQLKSEFSVPEFHDGLSGGEQTRGRIAAALSIATPLLLADEPTTDLDVQGIEQLKRRLQDYPGSMVLISHDRELLNLLCTRIWHLENGKVADFPGSYADYQSELNRRRAFQQFEYDQYRAEQARLKASAQRMQERASQVRKAPSRMGNSEARLHRRDATDAILRLSHSKRTLLNRMEHLEKKERPRDLPEIRMALGANRPISAKTALTVRNLSLKIGSRTLLANSSFVLPTGSRTALMGPNGSGKTSLIRALCQQGDMDSGPSAHGNIRFNPGVEIGWFDQTHARTLNFDHTALENVMRDSSLPESVARTVLARLNMRRDEVFKPVRVLSGGERAKVALAKLLLSNANLILLDEPTNHLDVFTMEALENLLSAYEGTLLFVSHDCTFASNVATRILTIEDSKISTFEGTMEEMTARNHADRQAELKRLEISTLEMRLAVLAGRMAAPRKGDNPQALNAEYQALSSQLQMIKRT